MPRSQPRRQLVLLRTSGEKMCKLKAGIVGYGLLFLIGAQCALAQLPQICGDEEDGTRLPLPLDCASFAVCQEREVAEIRRCPRGLHFNAKLGECDFQWRADCSAIQLFGKAVAGDGECVCTCCAEECPDNGGDEPTTPCLPESTAATPAGSSTTAAPPAGSSSTAAPPAEDTTDANPTPDTDSIDSTTGESTFNTDPTDSPITPTDSPSGGNVPAYCSDKRVLCVDKPDGSMLELPGVCTKYIQCSHGCCVEQLCPGGLYFNATLRECDHWWNVDCQPISTDDGEGEIVGPSGTTCSDQSVCAGQRDGQKIADPDSNGYFVCQCQCPIAMPCDKNTKFNQTAQVCDWDKSASADGSSILCPDGLIYNATSNQCDYPADFVPEVRCANPTDICKGQPEGKLFAVEGVCNKFYKCNFNCAIDLSCPNNLLFNATAEICDYPQNVDCEWEHSPPTGPEAGPSGISCETNGRCLGQREGTLFKSKTSCGGYVVCQCECEVPMECPEGLYWDETLKTCNYADQVACSL